MVTKDIAARLETALRHHLRGRDEPPRLGAAIHHALFPGGARVRPTFAIGVAKACGDARPAVADAVACAIEFLHCASLVHDDLPAFDDAASRRGKPSVHVEYGEALAVLTGDAMIVLAFQSIADVSDEAGAMVGPLVALIGRCAGAPFGLVGGQALESEPACALTSYHAAKTGALFEAAAIGGAMAGGGDTGLWQKVGQHLGAAYQIADDIHDCTASMNGAPDHGKPVAQDEANGRPNAVSAYGLDGALALLRRTIEDAASLVPTTQEAQPLKSLIEAQTERFVPKSLAVA